ncbi:hypothetical protein [Mycolicibacterium brisbanense]|uniref:Uncharacterized protein n=1 Tax=Mycolicibacterium brisbanense TaxID=146020 RepID=A0A100VUZ3_9MYCO|nr:hypothetical protein [Mycolicibacterium brisbanense]MCV7156639.1 hypothetical protein [Mycolicibacterium brisbanense]GAS86536.1 uncharacterized protein RMCB_0632 [Mycolicibacterium brisbanense]
MTKTDSAGRLAAFVMLAGTLISLSGLTWDIGWHNDVGPDSFFTLPHLFVYSGGAIAGLTSLTMVLRATSAQRGGQAPDPTVGGRAVKVLGVFSAPIGYLVGGIAAASFLLYGLWDEWWHGLYGFDVTIASPPHQGWLTSICVTMIGTAIVFAAARQHRWGRWGFMTAVAAFGSYASITSTALADVNMGSSIDWFVVTWVAIPVVCVLLGSQVLPRGGALGTGVLTLAVNLATWSFAQWAVGWYANVQHLALRDYVELGFPIERVLIPAAVLVFSVLVELLLRWKGSSAWLLAGSGAVGALAITWWLESGMRHQPGDNVVFTCVASAVIAAILGAATVRLGRALRVADSAPAARDDAVVAA